MIIGWVLSIDENFSILHYDLKQGDTGMMSKFLKFMSSYSKCPRCGSDNIDKKGGIWYCYECQKEW
jgi:hypothetical protein